MKRNLLVSLAIATTQISIITTQAIAADEGVQIRSLHSSAADREQHERDVDQVALQSQDNSIAKLTQLLKKYVSTRQEPILLSKLAELYLQKSGILFRISHGAANKKGGTGKIDLKNYHKSLNQAISSLNTLIGKYPNYVEIPIAWFSRGKAYEELGNKTAATRDYLYLVKNYPEAEQTSPAYMSLAEFAIEANNHAQAITYLKELEKRPEDPQYPFALYKLAWAYYNLKDIPKSLSYAEKQVAFYNERYPESSSKKESSNVVTSDSALKENTLLDVPVFYFEGLEQKSEKYTLEAALDYFRKLEKGPMLGRMILRFSKLLRSRNFEKQLVAWKNQILEQEWQRPESLEVLIITYEFQQNRRNFPALVETAKDLIGLYRKVGRENLVKYEQLGKAQKLILDTAEGLQAIIVKNKQTEEARDLSVTLAALYESFTQVVAESDPRIPQVHYNLAETLFTIENFEGATIHYRWVVDNMKRIDKSVLKGVADSGLKAVSSRYEVLRAKKLIPTEIKAVALKEQKEAPKLDPLLETWIEWIDTLGDQLASDARKLKKGEVGTELGSVTRPKESDQFKSWDNFSFEANRSLYSHGDVNRSVKRLEEFAKKRPHSEFGIPSATLVLDTFIVGQDWDNTYDRATSFRKISEWKNTEFGKKLYEVAADSLYKKLEIKYQAEKYEETLEDADDLMAEYKDSTRIPDCLSLAGAAALSIGDKVRAMEYFTKLISTDKDPGRVSEALLARAALNEEKYQFSSAVLDYRTYLNMAQSGAFKNLKKKPDDSKIDEYRRKILALGWMTGDASNLKTSLQSKTICTEKLESDCDKYHAILALQESLVTPPDEETTLKVFNRIRKMDSGEAKTLWTAYVLQGSKHLAFRDRNHTLRALGSGWKDLDTLSKFALLPYLNVSVPKTFQLNRNAMKDVAPLKADEKWITRRVEVIRELENAVTKIMDLPWARIRAETINVLASVYQDLSKGLAELPAPKGMSDGELASYQEVIRKLVLPFEEKAQEIRSKAFDIASRFAIEEESFNTISEPFFAENQSQAKKLKAMTDESKAGAVFPRSVKFVSLSLDYLPYIEQARKLAVEAAILSNKSSGKEKYSGLASEETRKSAQLLYSAWADAVKNKRWVQVAFFLQEAKERSLASPLELGLIRAVSMASAGARGEAFVELEELRPTLPEELRPVATLTLAQHYAQAFSAARAKELYAAFVPPAAPVVAEKAAPTGDRKPASSGKDQVR